MILGAPGALAATPNHSRQSGDTADYRRDFRAAEIDTGKRNKGVSAGIKYRRGWLALQAARSRDQISTT